MIHAHLRRLVLALAGLACSGALLAQSTPPRAAPPAAPASAASAPAQRVEVTGTRDSDTEARRRSTAAKIVIGREDIEKFGDATVGEVLRRLPGVTTPGAPGRGGPPRMRGLGNGFTQLLIDGQRLPPGFSLESLSPEQIERIEILRAPTAETGARAIAGTINIITREGFKRRLNDLRMGVGGENGQPQGGLFWTHNDNADKLTYTLNAGLFAARRHNRGFSDVTVTDVAAPATLLEARHTDSDTRNENFSLNLGGRLQWRLGETGDSLTLMPGLHASRGESHSQAQTQFLLRRPVPPYPEYSDSAHTDGSSRFVAPRLMLQYRQRVADWRLEGGGSLNGSRNETTSARVERRADASVLRTQDDHNVSRERSFTVNGKASRLLGPEGSEHSLVLGGEVDSARRQDTRSTLVDGLPALLDFGDDFQADTLRLAAYAQDEWALNKRWSLHGGLRWEGIQTRGDDGQGTRPENRNSVWTPLVHLLWKPDETKRDQVRLSLTRSWRAPATAQLIGRPAVNRLYDPALRPNTEAAADSAGNPELRPELATGIDLAFERFLDGGGLLSANLFHRRIKDLMRSTVALEQVSWSPFDRYVRRTRNVGMATTQGLELEAKFRLDQLVQGLAPVELRANLALYRSKVDAVPGPDNRLDDQARATANLGADYRFRGTPLTLGGNLNWVPGTTTRRAADETSTTSTKRQWDVFALWTFSPALGVRVLANNIDPRVYTTETYNDVANFVSGLNERNRVLSGGPSYTNVSLRLEMKL